MTSRRFLHFLLERLALCWREVPGVVRVFDVPPAQNLYASDFPLVLLYQVQANAEPADGSWDTMKINRVLRYALVAGITDSATIENDDTGSWPFSQLVDLIDNAEYYFSKNKRLSTNTLPNLTWVSDRVLWSSDGIATTIPLPNGQTGIGSYFTFTVTMSAQL